jgi:hypothetical protein
LEVLIRISKPSHSSPSLFLGLKVGHVMVLQS